MMRFDMPMSPGLTIPIVFADHHFKGYILDIPNILNTLAIALQRSYEEPRDYPMHGLAVVVEVSLVGLAEMGDFARVPTFWI